MTVISRMILHLEAGFAFVYKTMAEIEEAMAGNSSDENDADGSEGIVAEEIVDDDDNE